MQMFRLRRGQDLACGRSATRARGRPLSTRFALLLTLIAGIAAAMPASAAASDSQPTYGTAKVDGNISEWNLTNDFFAHMYLAGDPAKANLSDAYLRYDCSKGTLYVLVLQVDPNKVIASPNDAWATINGSPHKVYTGNSGNDGTPPDFAWVGLSGGYARGYEASFSIAPGTYTIVIHVEAQDSSGNSQTSANEGFNQGTPTTLTLSCGGPPPSYHPAFTINKMQRLVPGGGTTVNPNDQLTVQKIEGFVGQLNPGETRTTTVSCPSGYEVLDGSPIIQHVDQGAGTPADVQVLQSESTSTSAYTFTVHNPTSGQAEVQGFVTCVKDHTFDGGAITVTDPPVTKTVAFGPGTTTATLACPAGYVAVDPGFHFTSGTGTVATSEPVGDGSQWKFAVRSSGSGSVTLSVRCLKLTTSDGDMLLTKDLTRQVTVPAGQTVTEQVTCPVGYKGITASYDLPPGLVLNGDEPQPITRVFTLQNTTNSPQTATLDLVCLLNTTITTSTPNPPGPWTTSDITGQVGDTVEYKITVTNTGDTSLTLGALVDNHCDAGTIDGGPADGNLAVDESATYTCSHVLTTADLTAGSYSNTAAITATPPPGEGADITHSSNTVVVYLAGIRTVSVMRASGAVLARLTLNRASRVEVSVYGPAVGATAATAKKRLVLYGHVVRKNVAGKVKITIALNKYGRRALARRHHLKVTVTVRVTPRGGGKSRVAHKTVTLRA